jgi:hypothetical protein
MVLVAIFEKVKISKFSKTPINFKISKKKKKKLGILQIDHSFFQVYINVKIIAFFL